MDAARKILKSDFFTMKNAEDQNENTIEICCPSYSVWKKYFDQDKIVKPNSTQERFQIDAPT